jgi:hypothetical protein
MGKRASDRNPVSPRHASTGQILITVETAMTAGLDTAQLPTALELKGKREATEVFIFTVGPGDAPG